MTKTCRYIHEYGPRRGERCTAPLGPKNTCGLCRTHMQDGKHRKLQPQTEIVEARRFEVSG